MALALTGALALLLAFSASPASAATVTNERPLLFGFNGHDTTAGAFTEAVNVAVDYSCLQHEPPLTGAACEAYDPSYGAVYVLNTAGTGQGEGSTQEPSKRVIDKFNSKGGAQNFTALGKSSLAGQDTGLGHAFGVEGYFGVGSQTMDVAVDSSAVNPGRIYVAEEGGPIHAFDPQGNYLWTLARSTVKPCGVTVDAAGHLWVVDCGSEYKALEFASSGSPPAQIHEFPLTSGSRAPLFPAIDQTGNDFYLAHGAGPIDCPEKYVGEVFDSCLTSKGANEISVDQSSPTGHVFTVGFTRFREFDSTGAEVPGSPFGRDLIGNGERSNLGGVGIAYDPTRDWVYVSDRATNTVKVFGPITSGTVPDVTIGTTDEIGFTEATAHATINPQGVPDSYHFELIKGEVQHVTVEATGGAFTLRPTTATGNGTTASGSNQVTGVSAGFGSFHLGDAIIASGFPTTPLPKVTACSPSCGPAATSLTLSANASASVPTALIATETTAPVNYNAPARESEGAGSLEAALAALPGIGAGNVSVKGAPGQYDVVFEGALAGHHLEQMQADSSGVQHVTVEATGGAFTLRPTTATGGGTTTSGSNQVTGVSAGIGSFHAGDTISSRGLPTTPPTITACLPSCGPAATSLTLSANAEANFTGELVATETTAPINYNAPARASEGAGSLEAALTALPGIGAGNVSVKGAPGQYDVLFEGALAGHNLEQMQPDSSGLTGGTHKATVTSSPHKVPVTTITQGQSWASAESLPAPPYPGIEPSDSSDHPVSLLLTGLEPNTTYDVRLVGTNTENHLSSYSAPDTFTATPPSSLPPTVSGISPSHGPPNTEVTITGANLTGATAVKFGASGATIKEDTATQIKATSPSCSAGSTVDVTVTTPGGTSATSSADKYTCDAPAPTVANDAPGTITQTSIVMKGHVNNNGAAAGSACKFVIALEESPSTPVAQPSCNPNPVTGSTSTAVEATATGLAANTKYVYRVVATSSAGASTGEPDAKAQTLLGKPTVSALSPNKGPAAGGTEVTITGANLSGATAVKFGAKSATEVHEVNSTEITATSPSCTPGTSVDVRVTTPGGTSAATEADRYLCIPVPTIAAVSPGKGPTLGGAAVSISGANLSGATEVEFGTAAAEGITVSKSGTEVKVKAPAHAAGTLDVTVTTPGGASATGPADQYTYVPVPVVTGISPASGPSSGGTEVTISGFDLNGATVVKFGASGAEGFEVLSSTEIRATAPAGAPGAVHVRVSTAGGSSATSPADCYGYDLPTISAISPAHGPAAGGAEVTITGTYFAAATAVKFGAKSAEGFEVISPTEIKATAPAVSAGTTVNVRVSGPAGSSAIGGADRYAYDVPAYRLTVTKAGTGTGTVTSSPAGIDCGSTCAADFDQGTRVTLTGTPGPGAGAVAWSGCGSVNAEGKCVVAISAARSVTASFGQAPPTPPGRAGLAGTVQVKGATALLRLSCGGPGSCRGTLKLIAKLKPGEGRGVVIGRASFSLAPGASKTLRVRLARQAQQLLKSGRALKARVRGSGIKPRGVTLRAAHAPRPRASAASIAAWIWRALR